MTFDLVSTSFLEVLLNTSNHPDTERAIEELHRLKEVHLHLIGHLSAVKEQTEATIGALQSMLEAARKPQSFLPGFLAFDLCDCCDFLCFPFW
jgi:hypothetical protein